MDVRAAGESSLLLVEDSEFTACIAKEGGAVYLGKLMNAAVRGVKASFNVAVQRGGAIAAVGVSRLLVNFNGKGGGLG